MSDRVWQNFFDEHAPHYLQNCFAQNTEFECDFLVQELGLKAGMKILDIGCGAGRHCVGLAKRGLIVTGLDLSKGMLNQAQKLAASNGVHIQFEQANAVHKRYKGEFDAAICLCEGALGLIEANEDAYEHDLGVFACASSALSAGKPFLCTAMNGYRSIRLATQDDIDSGKFDPATMRIKQDDTMDLPEGQKRLVYEERLFIPPEMASLLKQAGFDVRHIWGGTAGTWHKKPIQLDEIEAMYVCVRR